MIGLSRSARTKALTLIKSRKRLLSACLEKDRQSIVDAMWLARNPDHNMAMTDPRAYSIFMQGSINMIMAGF